MELARKFEAKFKPAIKKWCAIYKNRVPFNLDDVTIEKFHSRLGNGANFSLYTFMIGDTTLTLEDTKGDVKVFYMMTRAGARALNSLPTNGAVPDLTMPVNRAEILQLIKADSGTTFPSDQIEIRPTATSSSLMGGVSVEAGGLSSSGLYREVTLTNLSFVLGSDGKLVTYQH